MNKFGFALLKYKHKRHAPLKVKNMFMVLVNDIADMVGIFKFLSCHIMADLGPIVSTCYWAKHVENCFVFTCQIDRPGHIILNHVK